MIELSSRVSKSARRALEVYFELVSAFVSYVPHFQLNRSEVLEAMQLDKKRSGSKQRFVLLHRPGRPFITDTLKATDVKDALSVALKVYNRTGV